MIDGWLLIMFKTSLNALFFRGGSVKTLFRVLLILLCIPGVGNAQCENSEIGSEEDWIEARKVEVENLAMNGALQLQENGDVKIDSDLIKLLEKEGVLNKDVIEGSVSCIKW